MPGAPESDGDNYVLLAVVSMTDVHRRTAVAERAARAGGVVARQAYRGEFEVSTKSDKTDLVTEADEDAQQQVVATILEEFPGDAILGEEDAPALGTDDGDGPTFVDAVPSTGDAWVIDPIDGTANFARGIEPWTTSVAVVTGGETVAAATYLPVAGEIFTAGDDGANRDGDAIAVSDRTDPETFSVAMLGRLGREHGRLAGSMARLAVEEFAELRRLGSMQATLAFVASGGLDAAFMATGVDPWDSLAGVHLIRQAGGTVTDLDGEPWRHDSESLVVSNGEAHEAVREAIVRKLDR